MNRLLISLALAVSTPIASQIAHADTPDHTRYTGKAISYDNFREYTHTGDDPFVDKNTLTLSRLFGYQQHGTVNFNYEGSLSLGIGTHRSAKILQTLKHTKTNAAVATDQLVTVSKPMTLFHAQIEPEMGLAAAANLAKINSRGQLTLDAVIGTAYYPSSTPNTKIGIRYRHSLINQYEYPEYDIRQDNRQLFQIYREIRHDQRIQGVSLAYQCAKQGETRTYKQWQIVEPENKAVILTFYQKFL